MGAIQRMLVSLASAAAASAYWNPSDKGANVTLSGGNATATNATGGAWATVRSVTAHSSGKYYAENLIVTNTANHQVFGLALATADLNNFLGSDNLGWSIQNDANNTMRGTGAQMGGTSLGTPPIATERNMMAVDFDTDPSFVLLWLGSKGNWPGGGVPATATNPTFKITKPLGALYLAVSPFSNGMSSTLKNQVGENAFTIPSGFSMFG